MPFTQGQIADIKSLISDALRDIISSDGFLSQLTSQISAKINFKEVADKIVEQEEQIVILKSEMNSLQARMNYYEKNLRRNNLRIYGLAIDKSENLESTIIKTINSRMKLNLVTEDIEECYRSGYNTGGRKEAGDIILKLREYKVKKVITENRKLLKGTQIVIAEDLPKHQYTILKAAVKELGKNKVWVMNGEIYSKIQGKRVKIKTMDDVEKLAEV